MSWSQLRRRLVATTAIGVVVAAVCAWGFAADRLDGVQNRWEDLLQPGLAASDDVVIVGIDRTSLGAVGAWPWPREVQAELLAAIGDGHPSVVLYDVLMDQSREGDDALIEAMRTTPTVLPTALTLTVGNDGPPEIVDAVVTAPPLAAAAAGLGHVNISNAGDTGVVRTLPLYAIDGRGIARPSIALTAVSVVDGASGPLIERPGGVQIGTRFVPLDDAELRINWSESLTQGDVIPAIDVLRGSVDADEFRDRVVVVGVTEPTLGDQHLVPTDRSGNTSGVVVLANATNTILSNGYLERPSTASQLGLIIAAALLTTTIFALVRLVLALLVALAEVAAVVLFASWRFHVNGTLWNVVWPVLAIVLAAAAGTVWDYFVESRHRRRAWRLFSTYVPADVVRELEDPARLQGGGVWCSLRRDGGLLRSAQLHGALGDVAAGTGPRPARHLLRVLGGDHPATPGNGDAVRRRRGVRRLRRTRRRRNGRGRSRPLCVGDAGRDRHARRQADDRRPAAGALRHRGPPRTGRGRPRRDGESASVRRRR